MSAYGIAGFVDGFVGGVDTRHRWKDRKRDQERQDRLDKMEAEANERRMRILDQQIAATDKAVADQKYFEDTFQGAVDATNASMAENGGTAAPAADGTVPATPGSTSGLPPPSSILPLGIPGMPSERPKVAPPLMPSPSELMQQSGSKPGVVNAPQAGGPMNGPGPVPNGSAATPPGPRPIVPPMGLPKDPLLVTQGPGPTGMIPAELYERGILPRRYIQDPMKPVEKPVDPAAAAADEEAKLRRLSAIRNGEDNPLTLRRQADEEIRSIREKNGAPPLAAIEDAPTPPTKDAAASAGKRPMDAMSEAWQKATEPPPSRTGPLAGKAPKSAPPEVKQLADTAAAAMAETTTPSMEAASKAASRGLPEVKPDTVPSEAKRKRFAADFMDHYREVGAPMVYEALISRGEFEKAEAFRAFLDRDETKAGMENWARAAFAATVGDMDTFATEIMEAYDRLDYFPDGTTILREESGFTRDKAGNITGAKITFKDAKSGNTWDQVFSDPNDLVRLGITLLAPEQAFEYYFEEQKAAAAAARGIATNEAEAEKQAAAAMQKRVDEVAKMIYEKSVGLDGVPTMTYAEARAVAEAQLSGMPGVGAAPAMPPIVRRPEG